MVVAYKWTLLHACRIRDKMHVVCKELVSDEVKSKIVKSEFDGWKISKHMRIVWKID